MKFQILCNISLSIIARQAEKWVRLFHNLMGMICGEKTLNVVLRLILPSKYGVIPCFIHNIHRLGRIFLCTLYTMAEGAARLRGGRLAGRSRGKLSTSVDEYVDKQIMQNRE